MHDHANDIDTRIKMLFTDFYVSQIRIEIRNSYVDKICIKDSINKMVLMKCNTTPSIRADSAELAAEKNCRPATT